MAEDCSIFLLDFLALALSVGDFVARFNYLGSVAFDSELFDKGRVLGHDNFSVKA